jgi:hypothetical protein
MACHWAPWPVKMKPSLVFCELLANTLYLSVSRLSLTLFQYAVFKNTILYLDQALAQLPNFSGDWKLQDVLTGNCASDLINDADRLRYQRHVNKI